MSDQGFEKQVQQTMDQFKLRPSDAVWAAVEKNIRKDKRRRRLIIWLPIGLLLTGGGGWYAMNQQGGHAPAVAINNITTPASGHADQAAQEGASAGTYTLPEQTTIADHSAATTPTSSSNTDHTANTDPKNHTDQITGAPASVTHKNDIADPVLTRDHTVNDKHTAPVFINDKPANTQAGSTIGATIAATQHLKHKKPNRIQSNRAHLVDKGSGAAGHLDQPQQLELVSGNSTDQQAEKSLAATEPKTTDHVSPTGPVPDSLAAKNDFTIQALLLRNIDSLTLAKQNASLVARQSSKKKTTSSKWQYGAQLEAGYSGITEDGLFGVLTDKSSKVADVARNDYGVNSSFNAVFPRAASKPSAITLGPAFSVGGFVQRSLSKKIKISGGIQYSYLSARTMIGSKVNATNLVNQGTSFASVVDYYYNSTNNEAYTYKYHFLELPVNLHWQFNKGKVLPLVWDFGFSANYMLSTTALLYDTRTAAYYKDNSFYNNFQWATSTGVSVGLFPQSKHPLYVGPMLKYNLTGLIKDSYSTKSQQLWTVGIRASILLKK